MIKVRILTGIVLALLVAAFIAWAPVGLFNFVLLVAIGLASFEFFNLTLPHHVSSSPVFGVVLTCGFAAAILFFNQTADVFLFAGSVVVMSCFLFYLFRKQEMQISLKQIAYTMMGVFYIGVLFSFCGLVRKLPQGIMWIYLLFMSTFLADTGAYIMGHWMGKHKLAPMISPGKTIEGFIGGVLTSVLVTWGVQLIFWPTVASFKVILIGLVAGFIGPLGDLSESLIKRGVNIKDSGTLIPGHGGVLDRVDALLFTAPIVYYMIKFGGQS